MGHCSSYGDGSGNQCLSLVKRFPIIFSMFLVYLVSFIIVGVSSNYTLNNNETSFSSSSSPVKWLQRCRTSSKCDMSSSISAGLSVVNGNRPLHFGSLLKSRRMHMPVRKDARYGRSAVIVTTVATPLAILTAEQEESPLNNEVSSSSSSSSTKNANPKSTVTPMLGFGSFRYPDLANSQLEDDEDYVLPDKGHGDESNVANMNVAITASANYEEQDIRAAFGDVTKHNNNNESVPNVGEQTNLNDDYIGSDTELFMDDLSYTKQVERKLIIGDVRKLPPYSLDKIFTMQQAIPNEFEGCYCDRHYSLPKSAHSDHNSDIESSHSVNNDEHDHPQHYNKSETIDNENLHPPMTIYDEVFCYCAGNSITDVPRNFSTNVHKIVLNKIGMEVLHADSLQHYVNLTEIYMSNMAKLHLIEAGAFSHLPQLMTIYIKMAPVLKFIPDGVFFGSISKLMHLKVIHSGIEQMPMIYQGKSDHIISMIDFDNSRIRNLTTRSVNVKAESLNIEYNQIEFVANHAFYESQIAKLSLKGNKKLVYLEEMAFSGLKFLRELDLSQTSITKLPTIGLSDSLEILRITDTFTMKEIPFVYNFKRMKEAHLTYPYHCCAFQFPANHNPVEYARLKRLFNTDRYCMGKKLSRTNGSTRLRRSSTWASLNWLAENIMGMIRGNYETSSNVIGKSTSKRDVSNKFGHFIHPNITENMNDTNVYGVMVYERDNQTSTPRNYDLLESVLDYKDGHFIVPESENDEEVDKYGFRTQFSQPIDNELPGKFGTPHTSITPKQEFCGDISSQMPTLRCFPTPDAFNPCEDVMGNNILRILVWLVVVAAVLGNSAVIIVLISGRFTFSVSKFLMINLAIADLMMGVYLSIIAVMDLRTMGVYFNYAIDWQHGIGCKLTGFITVLASELSIFTLTLITMERWFAITYAIQLNRRLHLGVAVKFMFGGWIYALLMASLPLFGVSSYSKTSICLPMEHRNIADNIYLITLLSINCFAFVLIAVCYGKMYISIISQKTRATMNDMTIAKRMSLLVVTDFICWAPIAFFGLTAIAGYPLIDVPHSKFLLVTFYPLNSCANPFLYAILTKQYRRDFFILLSRYGMCTQQAMLYKNTTRHNLNYHHHHHHQNHYHHRCESPRDSSEATPRANHLLKTNAGKTNGSIFSQLSCDGQNVHLYKYICKGHHHHHYCGMQHNSQASQGPNANNVSSIAMHSHCCSEHEQSSEHDIEPSDQACCSKYDQECVDSKSGSVASLTADKCKHRKHKRCHNLHHQHHYGHHHHHHRHHHHGQNRNPNHGNHQTNRGQCTSNRNQTRNECQCAKRRCTAGNLVRNDTSPSCCHSAVFSTVNIYPELSSDRYSDSRRQEQSCEQCSCQVESSSNENEQGPSSKLAIKEERSSQSREKNSSSDQVHIVRGGKDGAHNGRVIYTRNKSIAGGMCQPTISKMNDAKFKQKRSLPFIGLFERISFSKIGRLRTNKARPKNGSNRRPIAACSGNSSPYSSNSSCHHIRPVRCHHHRCCQHLAVPRQLNYNSENIQSENSGVTNRLPIEEQREILRQALQESTTVQEAVAVVEELSSGTRVSMKSSSSSNKPTQTDIKETSDPVQSSES